jgi:DNA-binding CsgD family transcriptional regulator
VCGITPCDTTHLSHAFTYTVADVLVRHLESQGLTVRYVPKKGGALVGFHERRSSYVADMWGCAVLPPAIAALIEPLRGLVNAGHRRGATVYRGEMWMDPRMSSALVDELSHMGGDPDVASIRHENGLTERELEIVRLVASGYKNKEVGSSLSISERTVKTHLTNIFQKLGVRDRVGLVMYALKHGLTGAAAS